MCIAISVRYEAPKRRRNISSCRGTQESFWDLFSFYNKAYTEAH